MLAISALPQLGHQGGHSRVELDALDTLADGVDTTDDVVTRCERTSRGENATAPHDVPKRHPRCLDANPDLPGTRLRGVSLHELENFRPTLPSDDDPFGAH